MRVANLVGISSAVTFSINKMVFNTALNYSGDKRLLLMSGEIPDDETLDKVKNTYQFREQFGDRIIHEFVFEMDTTFDNSNLIGEISKATVDALDFEFDIAGEIGWFAIFVDEFPTFEFDENYVSLLKSAYVSGTLKVFLESQYFMSYDAIFLDDKTVYPNLLETTVYNKLDGEYKYSTYYENEDYQVIEYDNGYLIKFNPEIRFFIPSMSTGDYIKLNGDAIGSGNYYLLKEKSNLPERILFSDSIGTWETPNVAVVVETMSGQKGEKNILKDLNLQVQDVCDFDKQYVNLAAEEDTVPGILNIDPFGNDYTITNDMKENGFTISGTTVGIEDFQEVVMELNNTLYRGEVLTNHWSIDVPQEDASNLEYETTYHITWKVQDKAGNETVVEKDILVERLNDAPVVQPEFDSYTVDEDNTLSININITDDVKVEKVELQAENGEVEINDAYSVITYLPNQDYNGEDTITVKVTDDQNAVTEITIPITVNPVNDAPEIYLADSITVEPGQTAILNYNTKDVDSETITVTAEANSGSVNVTDSTIEYTAPSEEGDDTITVHVSDGETTVDYEVAVTIKAAEEA